MLVVEGLEVERRGLKLKVDRLVSSRVTVILGRNGSGKTTLLRTIAGYIKPRRGVITLNGRDITNLPPAERGVGYMPQHPVRLPFKPRDAIQYFAKVFKVNPEPVIDKMCLEPILRKERLSGGEGQILALAILLLRGAGLLLLDEPTTGLDFPNSVNFWNLVKSLNIPMVYVTHSPVEAASVGDEIYLVENGILKGPFENKLRNRIEEMVEELNLYKKMAGEVEWSRLD
ncbi:Sulfate/thiosulfate import ATP-binding protein CysA [archaeon HR01]|nr:Sulfate/thiosulfate import ATP-binding protein CysA [archaeon HR01]